jgi:ketosteroid isomerase-like protein
MVARLTYAALLMVAPLELHAQSAKSADQSAASVIAAEVAGCEAYEHNDAAAIRRFLAEDYTLTDSKGVVTTKQDDIDDAVKHRVHYTTFRNKNMKVRLYPGSAIVTGQTLVKGTAAGKPFDVEVQFTDTLVLLNGRWVLAAGHVSRLRNEKTS